MTTPTLNELRAELKKKVVNQDALINKITSCLYKFCLAGMMNLHVPKFINTHSNLLINGSTGTGKTYTTKLACELLGLTFIEINGKSINQEGWHGTSIGELVKVAMDSAPNSTAHIVIFIDEFDKLVAPNHSSTNDNVAVQVQQGLLKYIEGADMVLNKTTSIPTDKFCFIFAGAFNGLDKKEKNHIGFHDQANREIPELTAQLIQYGMLPELAGRITSFVTTNEFTEEMLLQLLENDSFQFNKWIELFKILNLDMTLPNLKQYIVKKAIAKKLGARGLIQVCDGYIDEFIEEHSEDMDLYIIEDIIQKRYSIFSPKEPLKPVDDDPEIYNQLLASIYLQNKHNQEKGVK